jgi:hypothetical protein
MSIQVLDPTGNYMKERDFDYLFFIHQLNILPTTPGMYIVQDDPEGVGTTKYTMKEVTEVSLDNGNYYFTVLEHGSVKYQRYDFLVYGKVNTPKLEYQFVLLKEH